MTSEIGEMHRLRTFSKNVAFVEREHGRPWMYDDSGVEAYNECLGVLFDGSIAGYASKRKQKEGKLIAMDLMGHGQVLRELDVTAGLAVALGDSRVDMLKELDRKMNIDLIEGDVLSKKTWVNINSWVESQEGDGLDLVLCRPVGGYNMLPDSPDIFYYFLANIWQKLSSNNGVIAAELPTRKPNLMRNLSVWNTMLRSQNVSLWNAGEAILLTKTSKSPVVLPVLSAA